MRTIALAAIFFFGQVFVFCRLINKNVLKWYLLMCKEHTVSRHTNLNRNHPALCFYPTLSFFNLRSVCLEFFQAVTSETECAKLRASRAFVHRLPKCLTCSRAFASYVPSFFLRALRTFIFFTCLHFFTCLYFLTCLTCPHLFTCLRFFTCLQFKSVFKLWRALHLFFFISMRENSLWPRLCLAF